MTDKEIKKAWNTMKKEIGKECPDIPAGFTMTAKQIANRTATFNCGSTKAYDELIAMYDRQGDWGKEMADWCKELKAKYGTPRNEAAAYMGMIESSKAFAKFRQAIGSVEICLEETGKEYMVRFTY